MAERNVTFLIIAKDFASRVLKDVGKSSDDAAQKLRDLNTMGLGPLATAGAALGPALLPVLAGVTAGAVGLGATFLGAGAAIGVFGAVTKSVFSEVQEASKKSEALREKIHLLSTEIDVANQMGDSKNAKKFADARTKAVIEYTARLQQLPAPLRAAVIGMDRMRDAWQSFVDVNKPVVLSLMAHGMTLLAAILPKLQPLFTVAADNARYLMTTLERFTSGGGVDRVVAWLTSKATPAFEAFGGILIGLGSGIGSLLAPFAATSDGVLAALEKMSRGFAGWARTSGQAGVERMLAFAREQGPGAVKALGEIAVSLVKITQATAPLAPVSVAIAGALARIIQALPQPVLTSLVAGFIAWNVALQGVRLATIGLSVTASIAGIITGLTTALTGGTLATEANTAAKAAYSIATGIATAATTLWAGALWLADAALAVLLSPIFLVVAGIALLAGGVYLAWQHSELFRDAVTGIGHAIAGAAVWLGGAFMSALRAIPGLLSSVGGFFARLPGMILRELVAFPGQYVRLWKRVFESAAYAIGYGIGTVVRFFILLPGRVMRAVSALTGLWSRFWAAVKLKAALAAIATVNGVVGFFEKLPGRAGRAVSSLWSRTSGAFTSAYHGAKDWTKRAVDGSVAYFHDLPGRAWNAVSPLPGRIKSGFAGAKGWLVQAGEDVVRGLISGIGNMAGAAWDEAKRLAGKVVSGFKSAMHIGSPSRVMADEVGAWIPPGIAQGILSATPALVDTVASTMQRVTAAAKSPVVGRALMSADGYASMGGASASPQWTPPAVEHEVIAPIQLVADGKVLHEVLLKVKRTNRGLALGLA